MVSEERLVAAITGGAGDIGAAVARRLARRGVHVVILDRDLPGAERVAAGIRDADGSAEALACDQTDPDQVQHAFADEITGRLGRLDHCFANAGWARADAFLELPLERWQRGIDVNLTGTFLVCQAAARTMVTAGNGGSIVLTSSTGAVRVSALFSAYSAAKAGLNALAAAMAYELGPYDIRVNTVMPAATETAMTQGFLRSGAGDLIAAETPLGRVARPEDVAGAVEFLLGPDSGFVTGTSMLVDGGGTLGASWYATDNRRRGEADWQLRHEVWPGNPLKPPDQ